MLGPFPSSFIMSIDDQQDNVQTTTPLDLLRLPDPAALRKAFVVDRTRFQANCESMATTCAERKLGFRAHIKTHKTVEGIRMQLQAGSGCSAIICSTIMECCQVVSSGLVKEGLVKDMLYGVPPGIDRLDELRSLSERMFRHGATLRLMIDHPGQIEALAKLPLQGGRAWSLFIKVDGGGRRAGLPAASSGMRDLLRTALLSPEVEVFGMYSHFGQSYASEGLDEALDFLHGEVACVNAAAAVAMELGAKPAQPYVLSIGATPTAHVAQALQDLPLHGVLELHAGNYCCLDLQQVATNLKSHKDVATSVLTRVLSLYPERQEALCDAGGMAMAKDTGPIPGHGQVVWPSTTIGWSLGRVAQEHGVLTWTDIDVPGFKLHLGDCLRIVGQHSCMTLAAHPWYYCVDDGGEIIKDVWVPWKGW